MVRTFTHWSIEDYHRMIDSGLLAGRQVELIDGQVLDMPPNDRFIVSLIDGE